MSKVIKFYRVANHLHCAGYFRSARMISRLIRLLFSAEIPASCKIGKRVVLKHGGLGIVIHDRAIIGDGTIIFHHVTIGGREGHGYPTIGKNVYIGCGAVILGNITIEDNVKIGANAIVVKDVSYGRTVAGLPAKEL